MRILVVEDEEKVASFLKKGLEQTAYTVDVAQDGEEALDFIAMNSYDGIILDVMLPGRDGLSVVRELRKQGNAVPVLALTARFPAQTRAAAGGRLSISVDPSGVRLFDRASGASLITGPRD